MGRTRKFLSGVFLGYSQQILVVVAGLWLTPFLLQRIGQHDYGLWLVGLQILTWLSLMDFGIVALLPRETAYVLGRAGKVEDAHELPGMIAQTLRVVLWQWPLVAIAGLFLWLSIPATSQALRGPVALIVVTFTLVFPLRVFRAVLEGLQELAFLGRLQIFAWAGGTVLTVCLVLAKFHLYSLAGGWVLTQATVAVCSILRLKLKYPGVLPARLGGFPAGAVSSRLSSGFWISLLQVAQVLQDGSDLLVIGKTLGSSAVVPYSCTGKLINVLANQPTMIMHSASPGLSAIKSSGDKERAVRVATNLAQGMLLLSGAVVCEVLAVNRGFVDWWVGARQFAGVWLTALLAAAMILRHWNVTAIYSVFCFGYERRISLTTLADGLVSVIASFLLVRRFGAMGAPVGSMIGVCLVSLPANLTAISRESGRSPFSLFAPLWPWLWRFAPLAGAAAALALWWTPHGPFEIGLTGCGVGVVYGLVMFPVLLESPLSVYLPKKVTAFWNKVRGVTEPPVAAEYESVGR